MVSQAPANETLRLVRCEVAGATYGLEMGWVHSLQRSDRLRLASGPSGLIGHLAEAGGDLPVYSLARLLGRPAPAAPPTAQPIIVLQARPERWGLLVDRVTQGERVSVQQLRALPALASERAQGYFQGIVQTAAEMLLILAPQHLRPGTSGSGAGFGERVWSDLRPTAVALPMGRSRTESQLVLFSTFQPGTQARPLAFGLSIAQVMEIQQALPPLPVPGAHESVLGLVPWREQPVAVIDLAKRLGLPPCEPDQCSRLLIARARADAEPVGFLVRPAIRVLHLPVAHQPCHRELSIDRDLVKVIVELKNETVVLPDLAALVSWSVPTTARGSRTA